MGEPRPPDPTRTCSGLPAFGILGPLQAVHGDRAIALGPFKQRVTLGLLLCHANRVVSVQALSEALWDGDPPRTAHKNIQVYISALRKVLDTDADGVVLRHTPPGYLLEVPSGQLDASRLRELVRAGRTASRAGDTASAADLFHRAIGLWRGPVLADLGTVPGIDVVAERLEEQYLGAYEDWAEAMLALGQHADLAEGLEELAERHPFRERLRRAQMLALYRSGRQTEALARFDAMRQRLARDLGLQPSPVLARLYQAVLSGDPGLDAATPSATQSPVTHQCGLDRDPAVFTGRTTEVDALMTVLGAAPGRTVAISGPAGVGKTALTLHCGHRLADAFPHGRYQVGLRLPDGTPRTVDDVLDDVLRSVGGPGAVAPDRPGPSDRAARLRRLVAGRRTLIVFDDAGSPAQAQALLAAAGEASVVITGRRRLTGLHSAVHVTLDPMGAAEAIELLGCLVGRDRVGAEPQSARRLVSLCGGLPLAIRTVGAKLAGLRHLTLTRYAERLADDHRLLDELATEASYLADAYRYLCADERAVLGRVVNLPGPTFTLAEVAGALETDVRHAEASVERLIEEHFVSAGPGEVEAHTTTSEPELFVPTLIRAFVKTTAGSAIPTLYRTRTDTQATVPSVGFSGRDTGPDRSGVDTRHPVFHRRKHG